MMSFWYNSVINLVLKKVSLTPPWWGLSSVMEVSGSPVGTYSRQTLGCKVCFSCNVLSEPVSSHCGSCRSLCNKMHANDFPWASAANCTKGETSLLPYQPEVSSKVKNPELDHVTEFQGLRNALPACGLCILSHPGALILSVRQWGLDAQAMWRPVVSTSPWNNLSVAKPQTSAL